MMIPPWRLVLIFDYSALKVGGKDGADPFTRKRDLAEYTANAKGAQWGLGGLLIQEDLSSGRKAGSLSWSGMASTYCESRSMKESRLGRSADVLAGRGRRSGH